MHRRRMLSAAGACAIAGAAPRAFPASFAVVRRSLRFTLTFTNPLPRELQQQAFWCYLPADLDAAQQFLSADVSAEHRLERDALGHRILSIEFARFPAYAHKVVAVKAEVALDPATQPQAVSKPLAWLAPERYIESDDPGIRALAVTLQRTDDLETARAIYDWVAANVAYAGYVPQDLGAVHALQHRTGDCTEYADLVVALARASGIAARMMGGFVLDRDGAPRPEDYHNWAELHLGGSWRVVDAQKQTWLDSGGRYVTFRIYRDQATNAVALAHRYRMQGELTVTF